ncbi:hydroxylysine kinase-like [Saccoglossus kowalevskii]|uniref:Hydroxylysine kinase n=1 Tax=Saccoglossus kowalevskii TaxID=10224 RepID=A0ABM0GRJ2_SACKO|nr:PREDICTED: hydroxylysine kinase-like [Saccoglossus kowalevskii]
MAATPKQFNLDLDRFIKPSLTCEYASGLVKQLYNIIVDTIKQLDSYFDQNFYITVIPENGDKKEYVLKIVNAHHSQDVCFLDAQIRMMIFLNEKGLKCPHPLLQLNGEYASLQNINGEKGTFDHMVLLLGYVPGETLSTVDITFDLFYLVGQHLGAVDVALKEFQHEGLSTSGFIFSLDAVPPLKEYINMFKEEEKKRVLQYFISAFEENVVPNYSKLTRGSIHGDFNEFNILVAMNDCGKNPIRSESYSYKVCGLIDFGDIQDNYYIFEISVTIAHLMQHNKDSITAAGQILAGYLSMFPLTDLEKDLVFYCVAARLCQLMIIGMYTYTQNPNNKYILLTSQLAWRALELLHRTSKEKVDKMWSQLELSKATKALCD